MGPLEEGRSFDPDDQAAVDKLIDVDDEAQVARVAAALAIGPDELREACAHVGPNRTAIEIWLGIAQV
jgi:hypothetical protein